MTSPRPPAVAWLPWGPEALARAASEGKPVLLSITASWCHGCAVMDAVSYADARVASLVAERLVPVRVDADRRPDVNERYNLDGWPTTVLLTPSGEMLTGTTYLPADGLLAMLEEVTGAYRSGRDQLDARAAGMAEARRARPRAARPSQQVDLAAPEWLADLIVSDTDQEYGGFGAGGKFLHVAALLAGVRVFARTRSTPLGAALERTLDGMAGGGIRDHVDGGFFRYAGSREWMRPHTEKMLEDQAGLTRLYLDAARVFDKQEYVEVARDTIGFVHRTLADLGDARFFGSQAADEAYYARTAAGAGPAGSPPRVDRTLFTDWTAQAASAWLAASEALGDPSLAECAARALEGAIAASYAPGRGLAHHVDGEPGARGLLTDQVHAARALLDLHDLSGNPTWAMLAEELMRTAIRTLWDEPAGGLLDRPVTGPEAIGLLADPRKPPGPNALAATVLARLARLTGDTALQQRALETLGAQTSTYRGQGLFGAPYVLAVLEMFPA